MKQEKRAAMEIRQRERADGIVSRRTESQLRKIVRSNEMREYDSYDSGYNFTINDYRLLSFYLAYIDPADSDTWNLIKPVSEFQRTFGLESMRSKELDAIAQGLKEKTTRSDPDGHGTLSIPTFYSLGTKKVEKTNYLVYLATDAMPYFFKFNDNVFADGNFTKYQLIYVAPFSTAYQYKIYNLLRSIIYRYEDTKFRISFAELKAALGISPEKYANPKYGWDIFKDEVMSKSQRMIGLYTDIVFSVEKWPGSDVVFDLHLKAHGYNWNDENRKVIKTGKNSKENNTTELNHYMNILGLSSVEPIDISLMLQWPGKLYSDQMLLEAKGICQQKKKGRISVPYINGILKNKWDHGETAKQCGDAAAQNGIPESILSAGSKAPERQAIANLKTFLDELKRE